MIRIPDVTLIAVDTVCHDLTRLAVEYSIRNIEFGDVIVFSDKKETAPSNTRWVPIHISSNFEYELFTWYGVPYHVNTSHFLLIQWDGFVINSQAWEDEFLKYDYIGAPWKDTHIVGNGGFSLRSVKMTRFIANNTNVYRFRVPEDQAICCEYAPHLQKYGFKFADKVTASRFSFETVINMNNRAQFGFHAIWNFPRVLDEETLAKRISMFNKYVYEVRGSDLGSIDVVKNQMKQQGLEYGYMALE